MVLKRRYPRSLLKVGAPKEQYAHPLKCRISGPFLNLLNQNLFLRDSPVIYIADSSLRSTDLEKTVGELKD